MPHGLHDVGYQSTCDVVALAQLSGNFIHARNSPLFMITDIRGLNRVDLVDHPARVPALPAAQPACRSC